MVNGKWKMEKRQYSAALFTFTISLACKLDNAALTRGRS
jgi:hypothetical protein